MVMAETLADETFDKLKILSLFYSGSTQKFGPSSSETKVFASLSRGDFQDTTSTSFLPDYRWQWAETPGVGADPHPGWNVAGQGADPVVDPVIDPLETEYVTNPLTVYVNSRLSLPIQLEKNRPRATSFDLALDLRLHFVRSVNHVAIPSWAYFINNGYEERLEGSQYTVQGFKPGAFTMRQMESARSPMSGGWIYVYP